MSRNDNVIPFRKRPPSKSELEVFRQITRNWHPQLREILCPEHHARDLTTKPLTE